MLVHVRLDEQRRSLGVDADRDQDGGEIEGGGPKRRGVLRNGDRVQVDDAVKAIALVRSYGINHPKVPTHPLRPVC